MLDNETLFKNDMIKAQEGDKPSYKNLLTHLSAFLKNYLRKRIFNSSEIEEVIQEVLIAVHKSMHTYNSSKLFMSWFMTIVEYKIIDYIRSLEKNKTQVNLDALSQMISSTQTDSDLKLDLDKAMNKLSAKEKTILSLLKNEGQSIQQVALDLQLTESNVKIIAHRAFINLRKNLGFDYEKS